MESILKFIQHNASWIFGACLFGTVAVITHQVLQVVLRANENPIKDRLRGNKQLTTTTVSTEAARAKAGPGVVERISKVASRPLMPKQREEQSRLRRRLSYGGMYSPSTIQIFVASKFIMLFAGLLMGFCVGLAFNDPLVRLLVLCCGALFGYLLPGIWLNARVRGRQRVLQKSLPDALDLMVVCVEAGLTIDAAIQRVGQEISLAHPEISRELGITHMETRIGLSRVEALRNLGHRTGSHALQSLAAMLVQAERFGTSIAQ